MCSSHGSSVVCKTSVASSCSPSGGIPVLHDASKKLS